MAAIMYGAGLFKLGTLAATPAALESLTALGLQPLTLINRHQMGDWAEMSPQDRQENKLSVKEGFRIFSAYTYYGIRFWVITEADRSVTTVLLPSDY